MMMSGNDCWNKDVFSRWRKFCNRRWWLDMNRQSVPDSCGCNRKRATANGCQTIWRNEQLECRWRPKMATTWQNSLFSSLAYAQRDDQAELARVAWFNTKTVYLWTVTHLSTNPAQRRVTSLMCPMTLALSQTATYIGNTQLDIV